MRWFRMMLLGASMVCGAAMTMAGCGGGGCEELADICKLCPENSAEGLVAADSCERTVRSGDDDSCDDRIDQGTYASFGCQ